MPEDQVQPLSIMTNMEKAKAALESEAARVPTDPHASRHWQTPSIGRIVAYTFKGKTEADKVAPAMIRAVKPLVVENLKEGETAGVARPEFGYTVSLLVATPHGYLPVEDVPFSDAKPGEEEERWTWLPYVK